MSAADRREQLEAYTWRLFARRSKVAPGQLVASVLAAADRYRDAAVGEAIARAAAEQLAALGQAEAEEHRRGTS